MKRSQSVLLPVFLLLLLSFAVCAAAQIDPILLNKDNTTVAVCNDEFFITVDGDAVISATLGTSTAKAGQLFLILNVKVLFLYDDFWDDGFNQETFTITHGDPGDPWVGSLDVNVTNNNLNHKNYDLISDTLVPPAYKTYRLVFSIPDTLTDKNNWMLHFTPIQDIMDEEVDDWDFDVEVSSGTGGESLCETEIPFRVQ